MFKYMPHFEDNHGNQWDIVTVDFVILGFGRGLSIKAYCQALGENKTFTYSYLKDELTQWDSCEVIDCQPLDGNFQSACQKLFKLFDNKE